jgi:hypothetical protein
VNEFRFHGQGLSPGFIGFITPSGDVAGPVLTIQGGKSGTGATTSPNADGVPIIYDVQVPRGTGLHSFHQFQVSGAIVAKIGKAPSVPGGMLWLASVATPGNSNFSVFSRDDGIMTGLNASDATNGQIGFFVGGVQYAVIAPNPASAGARLGFWESFPSTININTRTLDSPTKDITIAGQAPFSTATGANRTPGNILLDIPVPTNGGTTNGFTKLSWGGTVHAAFGITTTASAAGVLFLGTATPVLPGGANVGNHVMFGDGKTDGTGTTGINVGTGGAILFTVANNVRWQINDTVLRATSVQAAEIQHGQQSSDTATFDFTVKSQAPFASATTIARQTPGNLIFEIPSPVTDGVTTGLNGFVKFKVSGNVVAQVGSLVNPKFGYIWLGNVTPSSTNFVLLGEEDVVHATFLNSATTGGTVVLGANALPIINVKFADSGLTNLLQFSGETDAAGVNAAARIEILTQTGNNPAHDLTIQAQAPSGSATGGNVLPGNLSLVIPSPTSGTVHGYEKLTVSGIEHHRWAYHPSFGGLDSRVAAALWMGLGADAPTSSNHVLYIIGDSSLTASSISTQLNVPVSVGFGALSVAGSQVFKWKTDRAQMSLQQAALFEHQTPVSNVTPFDFTIRSQAPFASATTVARQTPGALILEIPSPVTDGVTTGNLNYVQIKQSGTVRWFLGATLSGAPSLWHGSVTPGSANYSFGISTDATITNVNAPTLVRLQLGGSNRFVVTATSYQLFGNVATWTTDTAAPSAAEVDGSLFTRTGSPNGDLYLRRNGAWVSIGTAIAGAFTAGGDLSGTNTSQQVIALTGTANVVEMRGTTIQWDTGVTTPLITQASRSTVGTGVALKIQAQSCISSATTGGDLILASGLGNAGLGSASGKIHLSIGGALDALVLDVAGTASLDLQFFQFTSDVNAPTITQAAPVSSNGHNLSIIAQAANGSGNSGGSLILQSGATGGGLGINGDVILANGITTAFFLRGGSFAQLNYGTFQFAENAGPINIKQLIATTASNGSSMTLAAQDGKASGNTIGGDLILAGGLKNGAGGVHGKTRLQAGGTDILSATDTQVFLFKSFLTFDALTPAPQISQSAPTNADGQTMTIAAQNGNGTSKDGGLLALKSGTKTSGGLDGLIVLTSGVTDVLSINSLNGMTLLSGALNSSGIALVLNAASAHPIVFEIGGTNMMEIDPGGQIRVTDATVIPTSNPTGAGLLYEKSGSFVHRSSGSVVMTMAPGGTAISGRFLFGGVWKFQEVTTTDNSTDVFACGTDIAVAANWADNTAAGNGPIHVEYFLMARDQSSNLTHSVWAMKKYQYQGGTLANDGNTNDTIFFSDPGAPDFTTFLSNVDFAGTSVRIRIRGGANHTQKWSVWMKVSHYTP